MIQYKHANIMKAKMLNGLKLKWADLSHAKTVAKVPRDDGRNTPIHAHVKVQHLGTKKGRLLSTFKRDKYGQVTSMISSENMQGMMPNQPSHAHKAYKGA